MAKYTYQGQQYTVDDSVPQDEAIRKIKAHVAKSTKPATAPTATQPEAPKQRTTIGEDVAQGFAGMGNLADTFGTMTIGGIRTLLGQNKDGKLDPMFESLAERKKSRLDWAGGQGKEKGVSGAVISALAGLPGMVLAPVTGLERATDLMDAGAPLKEAGPAGAIDSALSTGAALLPVVGKTIMGKAATGGVANVLTGGASDVATQGFVSDKKIAEKYNPLDLERRMTEFIMGAGGGALTGKTKPKSARLKVDDLRNDLKGKTDSPEVQYFKEQAEMKMRDDQTVARLEAAIAKQSGQEQTPLFVDDRGQARNYEQDNTYQSGRYGEGTLQVTPDGQAYRPSVDAELGKAQGEDITRAAQTELEFWKQRAAELEAQARQAELPPELLRAQGEDPFNPYPVAGTPEQMEGFSRAVENLSYNQVPEGGVIPRDSSRAGLEVPRGNQWAVDENGMPVRQGLPQSQPDLSLSKTITGMLNQNKGVRDDLGNAIQEASGPRLGQQDAFGTEPLSGPMGAPDIPAGGGMRIPQSQRGGVDFEMLPKAFRDFVTRWHEAGGNFSHVGVSRMLDDQPVKLNSDQRKMLETMYPETAKTYQQRIDKAWENGDPEKARRYGKRYDDALIAEAVVNNFDAFGKGFKLDGPRYDSKTGPYAGKVAAQEQAEAAVNAARFVPKSQRGAIDVGRNQKRQKIDEILGTKFYAPSPEPDDVIARALADGKDVKNSSINFSAGATLEAMKRNSPLVQGVSRIVQRNKNIAEANIKETVFPVEEAFRKLNPTEVQDVAAILKAEMFENTKFSVADLAAKGVNEKQLIAYQKIRDMFDASLAEQNRVRALQGKEPVTAKEAYLSSRWQGDFRRAIHNKEGKLIWYLAADNKIDLDRQTKALTEAIPEEFGGYTDSMVRSTKRGTEAKDVYSTMLDVLGRDDPAIQKIKAWVEDQVLDNAAATLGQEKHFKDKANIRGFVGDRPGKNPVKEALAMIQQQINYSKNAYNWSAMQEAGTNLKTIFSNTELALQQPENMRFAKEYFADQLGFNENAAVRALEDQVRAAGVSPNQIAGGVNTIKSLWVTQKLAVNAGFMSSNVVQAANILPNLVDLQVKYGGNPLSALAAGMTFGPFMAIAHVFKQDKKLISTLGKVPGTTPFLAKAMKYAEDNSIISRTLADETPIEQSFGPMSFISQTANKSINVPESFLRAFSYMTYVEQLKSSGRFGDDDIAIYRLAEERTNASMADYRQGEKAMIFNKLGNMGNAMNVLTTFPINYYNQWSWALRESGRGNPLPALTMFVVQGYMAGLMGVPGFAEADKLVELLKDFAADQAPKAWNKVKNISLKQLALDSGGADLLYGSLSEDSGVAFTSRAAAPIPSEMVGTPVAPMVDMAKQAGSVLKAAADPTSGQKWAQAAYNVAPTGLQGALETGLFKDIMSVPRKVSVKQPDGSMKMESRTLYGKPTDMASRTGMYARTEEEEFLRSLGLRSQKEVVSRDQTYFANKQAATANKIVAELPNKMYNSLRNNNVEKFKDFALLYTELTGRDPTIELLETQAMQEFTTGDEKLALRKQLPLETLMVIKRMRDNMKAMGYQ